MQFLFKNNRIITQHEKKLERVCYRFLKKSSFLGIDYLIFLLKFNYITQNPVFIRVDLTCV